MSKDQQRILITGLACRMSKGEETDIVEGSEDDMNIYEPVIEKLKEEIEFLKRQLFEAETYFRLIRNAAEDGLDEIHCE